MEITLRTNEEFQQQYITVSFPSGSDSVEIIPFKNQLVGDWAELGDERILVLGKRGKLVILNARNGEVLAQEINKKLKRSKIIVFEEIGFAVFYQSYQLQIRTLPDLKLMASHDAISCVNDQWRVVLWENVRELTSDRKFSTGASEQELRRFPKDDTAFKLSGNRIFIPYFNSVKDKRSSSAGLERGYAVWTPETDTLNFHLTDSVVGPFADAFQFSTKFISVSPSGKYALRLDITSMPFHHTKNPKSELPWKKDAAKIHRDLFDDGVPRFGTQLELWDTTLGIKQRSIVVRFDDWLVDSSHLPESMQEKYAVQFRNDLYHIYRLLDESEVTAKDDATVFTPLDDEDNRSLTSLMRYLGSIYWEPDETAFWVQFSDRQLRRVTTDGDVSTRIIVERWTDKFKRTHGESKPILSKLPDGSVRFGSPLMGYVRIRTEIFSSDGYSVLPDDEMADYEAPVAADNERVGLQFIEKLATVESLASITEDSAVSALENILRRVDGNYPDHFFGNESLMFGFKHDNEIIREPDFFELIVSRGWKETVPVLERLLDSYINYLGGVLSMPFYDSDNGVGALSYPLRAYVLLSPDPFRVWQDYMYARDGEHERYCLDHLFPEYVARHSWEDERSICIALFMIKNSIWSGTVYPWNHHGLLDAAEESLSPERFVQLASDELKYAENEPVPVWQNEIEHHFYLSRLLEDLDESNNWQSSVKHLLSGVIGK